MPYIPTPYTDARKVPARVLRRYHDMQVFLDMENPDDPDGDLIEYEFYLFFYVAPAEPDVGIDCEYLEDLFYAEADGSPVPEDVWVEIDKIDARHDDRKPVSEYMDDWNESNVQSALEWEGF